MDTKYLILFFFLFSIALEGSAQRQPSRDKPKQQILLLGTFHFNNPGADAVKFKTLDIQSTASQKELELISDKIKSFGPTKMFIEWDINKQSKLDSLYGLYLKDQYHEFVENKYKGNSAYSFYSRNEIFQLAFRAARKLGLPRVFAVDYELDWPADTAFRAMNEAHQDSLTEEIQNLIQQIGKDYDRKMQTMTLTDLLLDVNTDEDRRMNAGFYVKYFSRAGNLNDFSGAYSVSEWYRRNLYMYSNVQKLISSKDERILVLLGAGHTAMLDQFIRAENVFEIVDLKDVLKTSAGKVKK